MTSQATDHAVYGGIGLRSRTDPDDFRRYPICRLVALPAAAVKVVRLD